MPLRNHLSADDRTVAFEDVTVRLDGNVILSGVSAHVPAGGSTVIVGPNGAGKTTLLLALLGLLPYSGRIHSRAVRIGYVPQRLAFDRGMSLTVTEFLAMGNQRLPFWFGVRRAQRERARMLLETVRAGALGDRRLGALSGGEMQRVLLALALVGDPDLLVLDEPSAGVDAPGGAALHNVLEHLRREWAFTQLIVSHDLSAVATHATHVICLNRTVIAEGNPRDVLSDATLRETFGLPAPAVEERGVYGIAVSGSKANYRGDAACA